MLSPSQPAPHRFPLLRGDDIFLLQALVKAVPVLAMEEGNPPDLFTKIGQNAVVLLGKYPDALLCMAATEGKLRQHVFLFGDGFRNAAVIDYVQGWLALKHRIESPEIVVQPFTRVNNVDLRVGPYPGGVLIRSVVSDCGTQNDYVATGAAVDPLRSPNMNTVFPQPVMPHIIAE